MTKQRQQLHTNLGLVFLLGIVGVAVTSIIVPLSSFWLDLFMVASFCLALHLFIMSFIKSSAVELSTLPSLLLLGTLLRLGLNIATTRSILSRGEAGKLIESFGTYLTGGSLMVGFVVLVVLMIVQFLVVSKGGERVAEVMARFTLDAMPGKQMSIDADLRAGIISAEVARQLRIDLNKESRFYGAMDGAMKFIKGDVIAAFVLFFINGFGGLFVGMVARDLSFADAMQRYTLLTIGDSLATQVPSLFLSLASAMMATKIDAGDQSGAREFSHQLFNDQKPLLGMAVLFFVLALVPFLPGWPFLVMSALFGALAYALKRIQKAETKDEQSLERLSVEGGLASLTQTGSPLVLEVSSEIYAQIKDDTHWQNALLWYFPQLVDRLQAKTGVPFPRLALAVNQVLDAKSYVIKIHGVPEARGVLVPQATFYLDLQNLSPTVSQGERLHHELASGLGWHMDASTLFKAPNQYKAFLPQEALLRHLTYILKNNATSFLGIQQVKTQLVQLEKSFSELVREVCPRLITLPKLTEILKRLVLEQISIIDLRQILEILSQANPESKSAVDLVEIIRLSMGKGLYYHHLNEKNELHCLLLDPQIEQEIQNSIQKNGSEYFLTLAPETISQLVTSLRASLIYRQVPLNKTVITTQVEIRRFVRRAIEADLPDLAVLSFQELDPKVLLKPVDTISLNYEINNLVSNQSQANLNIETSHEIETSNELVA